MGAATMRGLALAPCVAILALAGCASPAPELALQPVRIAIAPTRSVQYTASQVQAVRVALTRQSTGTVYAQTYSPAPVSLTQGGGTFEFAAQNLPTGVYTGAITAYLDPAATLTAGTSTCSAFTVGAGGTALATFDPLALAATPVGTWSLAVTVTVPKNYNVKTYTFSVTPTDGQGVPSVTLDSSATSLTKSWSNLPAYPGGLSTASVTVRATRPGKADLTATQTVTRTIVADSTVQSQLAFSL